MTGSPTRSTKVVWLSATDISTAWRSLVTPTSSKSRNRTFSEGVIEEQAAEHAADESAEDGELVPTSEFDNDLTKRYPGKEVEVHDVPGAFVFHVETDGSFTVPELVRRAVESISDRAAELEEKVAI